MGKFDADDVVRTMLVIAVALDGFQSPPALTTCQLLLESQYPELPQVTALLENVVAE